MKEVHYLSFHGSGSIPPEFLIDGLEVYQFSHREFHPEAITVSYYRWRGCAEHVQR